MTWIACTRKKRRKCGAKGRELKATGRAIGTGDTGALALKQQIALQQYAEARNEYARLRSELQRAKDDLQMKQAWLKALKDAPQQAAEPEPVGVDDPTLAQLPEQIEEIDTRLADHAREDSRNRCSRSFRRSTRQPGRSLAEKAAKRRKELGARCTRRAA